MRRSTRSSARRSTGRCTSDSASASPTWAGRTNPRSTGTWWRICVGAGASSSTTGWVQQDGRWAV